MPQKGFIINGGCVDFQDALALAARGEVPYPPAMLRALFNDRTDPAPTASALGGCLREWDWKRTHDWYETPERGLPALFGHGVHAMLERAAVGGQQERRLAATVDLDLPAPYDHLTVTGTTDHIDGDLVLDWKSKVYLPKRNWEPPARHIVQVHIYAWLASKQPNAAPLSRWSICYFDQKTVQTFSGDLRPLDGVEAWVKERLTAWGRHVLGLEPLPYCDAPYCQVCRAAD